jgi:DNA adenine methylase
MNSPIKWPGGKRYLASRIVAIMPPHLHYVEPYAGSLAVMLAKDPRGVSEVANDLNDRLTNFWRVLQEDVLYSRFKRTIEATPFSEWEYERARKSPSIWHSEVSWEDAVNFFIECRQSLAGRMTNFAPLTKNRIRRGMNEQAAAWLTAIEGLPEVHARLKRVVILNRTALEVIRQQDGPNTLFYLDPPYLHETRETTKEYGHYEMTKAQHASLLDALQCIQGKFLLSGYYSDLYQTYANKHQWNRHIFDLPNNAASGKTKRRMTEHVWCNF